MARVLLGGPIEAAECIRMARHALVALKLLHANGILHRAVCPAHIFRSHGSGGGAMERSRGGESNSGTDARGPGGQHPTYKLLGFGAAIGIDPALAPAEMMVTAQQRKAAAGPPAYRSPEMLRQAASAGYPTDIWSMGVTMFEVVTGAHPFRAESEPAQAEAVVGNLDEAAPSVLDCVSPEARPRFDHTLARVIERALQKRVGARCVERHEKDAEKGERHEACDRAYFVWYQFCVLRPFLCVST
jgi:eukaryotic-like serine/threonine-protein kinase